MKKKLEELNLTDNFLFGSMVERKGTGEEFVRALLEVIFGRKFGEIRIVPQKVYSGADTDLHGVRLDVYVETEPDGDEDGPPKASVYDVEPEQNDSKAAVQGLPMRTRFYRAKIDAASLGSGEDYRCLKRVTVVMIVTFDPFGSDRMVYTIRNMCQEEPGLSYEDGARTLFLYTKGKRGRTRKNLRELLHYMEDTTEENAVNPTLKRIHKTVEQVRHDKEVSLGYMKIFEREEMLREEGRDAEKVNTERERLRADVAEQKADAAEQKADAAEQKADAAERRAKEAEAENAALMQKLSDAMEKMQELSQEVAQLRQQVKPA
ncbi:MAG: hypothetical protein LUG93_18295 [Lachnospiraceae bacterium]|nr:hypothetical protein [Lachnospiraceae bacterium]